jgi:hypothetical protein
MSNRMKKYMSYKSLLDKTNRSEIKQESVAITDYVSLPLPSLQYTEANYVLFVVPMALRPNLIYGQLKYTWMVSANRGALVALLPHATHPEQKVIESQFKQDLSLDNLQFYHERMKELLEALSIEYFSGNNADDISERKYEFKTLFLRATDPALLPFYQQVAGDFFKWLDQ